MHTFQRLTDLQYRVRIAQFETIRLSADRHLDWNMSLPHIHIYTPPRSPEPTSIALVGPLYYPSPIRMSYSSDMFITWTELTPWYRFMQFIRTLNLKDRVTMGLSQHPTRNYISMDEPVSTGTESMGFHTGHQLSTVQNWIDYVSMSFWVELDPPLPAVYTGISSYLPPTPDGSVEINVEGIYDLSRRSTQLECIKLAANLISNNRDIWRTIPVIVELAKDKSNLLTLKGLLDRNLLIADAVAEKLLVGAARYQNLPLLRTLVEHGVEIDLFESAYDDHTALLHAIDNCDEDAVTYLLDHGADSTKKRKFYPTYEYESTLDFAVERGDIKIIEQILTPRTHIGPGCPDITIRTLRLATLLGDVSIMNLLVDRNPALLDEMKSKAGLLSEAGAVHKTNSILLHLQSWGIDIAATNDFGKGSALAVACYSANMPLIYWLLDLGADIDGLAVCDPKRNAAFHPATRLERKKLDAIRGRTALQIAVEMEYEALVQLLLSKGADPNKFCLAYPLQIATRNGKNSTVKMLLEAGANVDSAPAPHESADLGPLSNFREKPAVQLALERGYENVFLTLVKCGAKIPYGNSEVATQDTKWNPLRSAIIGGNLNIVHYIIKSTRYNHWGTPECLAQCVQNLDSKFTMMLIDDGVFSEKALYDVQVLCNSVYKGDIELVKSLVLGIKSTLGELLPGYGAAGMALAVLLQKETMIKFFWDVGVKPYDFTHVYIPGDWQYDREPQNNRVEFHWEYSISFVPIEDEKYYLKNGTSALHQAFMLVKNGKTELESLNLWSPKVLMDRSRAILQDMKLVSQNRGILFAYGSAIESGRLDIVNLILDTGLDVREIDETIGFGDPDKPYCSSLQRLLHEELHRRNESDIRHQVYEVAMALLNYGAAPDCLAEGAYRYRRAGFHTPLQYAARLNATSLVRRLLDMGADVNAKPNLHMGATAVQFAAINGNFEILNILLDAGANVNALPADHGGRYAIEGASEWGRLDMVTYLLEAGANLQGRANKQYRRSVYRAWGNGHRCLVRTIQDWKIEKFGADDCDDIYVIMQSMTDDELDFIDLYAKEGYKEYFLSNFGFHFEKTRISFMR